MRIVVGLGNPGPEYEGTRHNIGFAIVDRVARELGWAWGPDRFESRWSAGQLDGVPAALMKPRTYMNLSGRAVREAASFYKTLPAEILVVYDDFNIPLGTLRYREKGSSGGQKGIASVLEAMGTREIPRLRLGVGPVPAGRDPSDFVLSRFGGEEREDVSRMTELGAERVEAWMRGKGAA